jgi:hypothetical protein
MKCWMLFALVALVACSSSETAETSSTSNAEVSWHPVVAGNINDDTVCGYMAPSNDCFDCLEVSSGWYVRWMYEGEGDAGSDPTAWDAIDGGYFHADTAVVDESQSCLPIDLGAPMPEGESVFG